MRSVVEGVELSPRARAPLRYPAAGEFLGAREARRLFRTASLDATIIQTRVTALGEAGFALRKG